MEFIIINMLMIHSCTSTLYPQQRRTRVEQRHWGEWKGVLKISKYWMAYNKLKLNDSQTEVLVVTSKVHAEMNQDMKLKIGDTAIKPTEAARNLGIIFDNRFSLESHVAPLSKSAFFQIKKIYRI